MKYYKNIYNQYYAVEKDNNSIHCFKYTNNKGWVLLGTYINEMYMDYNLFSLCRKINVSKLEITLKVEKHPFEKWREENKK